MTEVIGLSELIVLGDSGAQGRDDPGPDGDWIGWSRRLATRLGINAGAIFNVGRAGAVAADVVREQLPAVRGLRPRLVVLGCGLNDVLTGVDPGAFGDALAEVIAWARSAHAPLLTAAVPIPPLLARPSGSPLFWKRTLLRLHGINRELVLAAQSPDVELVGGVHLRPIESSEYWSSDGIHLNAAGHAYVADAMAEVVRSSLLPAPRLRSVPR